MKEITETCPHCGKEVTMRWDVERDGFKAFCPHCKKRLMLCSECLNHGEYSVLECDYNSKTDSCRYNPYCELNTGGADAANA